MLPLTLAGRDRRTDVVCRVPKAAEISLGSSALAERHCLVQQLTNATGLDAKPRVSHLTHSETHCFLDFTLLKLLSNSLALLGTCKINFKPELAATVLAQPEVDVISWVMSAHHDHLVVPKI